MSTRLKPYPRIFRVKVMLLNDRDFPLATATIPEFVITDLADLITGAHALNSAIEAADVVRAIWRHGSRQVFRNLRRGVRISVKDLPEPRPLPPPVGRETEGVPDDGTQTPAQSPA